AARVDGCLLVAEEPAADRGRKAGLERTTLRGRQPLEAAELMPDLFDFVGVDCDDEHPGRPEADVLLELVDERRIQLERTASERDERLVTGLSLAVGRENAGGDA